MLLCIFISPDSTLYFCWNTSFQHLTWAVQISGKVLHLYVGRAALLDEASLAGRLGLGGIWTALNIIVHHSTLSEPGSFLRNALMVLRSHVLDRPLYFCYY